jgi:tRNA_anti-like
MNQKIKKSFIFLAVIAIAGIVAGYLLWNKPHADIKDAESVNISALDLYNIFIVDSAKANSTFLAKVVKVSGRISGISTNQQRQQVVLLKTSIKGASVNCTMEEMPDNHKTGDSISLKGICSGYIPGDAEMGLPGDVFLTRCYHAK